MVVLGYLTWCGGLYFLQTRLIFPSALTRRVLADEKIPKYVDHWWLDVNDGSGNPVRVEAYFIAQNSGEGEKAPLVVYFHGNADSVDRSLDSIQPWRKRGFAVLIPEYRGYSRCGGTPGERVIVEDSIQFINKALERPDVDSSRVVFHGWSLGTGVAAQVATRIKPRAIVSQSGFTSVASFATGYGVPSFLITSPFRSDEALGAMSDPPPMLILHSPNDEIIPYSHAGRLRERIKGSRLYTTAGYHSDDITKNAGAWEEIDRLLRDSGVQETP
jgi:dipeptidyl aminopeptidase/acylaminoacyl peptidase